MNKIVATLLLYESNERVLMSTFIKNCVKLYTYIRKRNLRSVCTIEPNKLAVERELAGLGFRTKPVSISGRDRIIKDSEIILEPKRERKTLASLAYYSNSLLQDFVMDCCAAHLIQKHFMSTN